MKRTVSILLSVIMILSCFSINGLAAEKSTAFTQVQADTGNVSFGVAYPEVGKEMKASVADKEGEKLLYKWFVDNNQINNFTNSYTPIEDDMERMITVKVYDLDCKLVGSKSVFVSELPVIYIETENRNSNIKKDNYMSGQMNIQGNGEFSNPDILYTGKTEIKGRGNSTWNADKKPYKLKLDSKANLFDMGKNKHWVLLSNPYDPSNMKNYLSYNLSNEMGLDASKSVLVDLVLNGTSVGVYQLAEHVRVDETRVDITDWEGIAEDAAKAIYKKNTDTLTKDERDELIDAMTADLSWTTTDTVKYKGVTYTVSDYYKDVPDITGGYLIEGNRKKTGIRFTGVFGSSYEINTPEGISDEMRDYIRGYFNAYETALKAPDFCTEYNGVRMRYTDLIDVDSFAKGILLNELFTNSDFGYASMWFSKDVDGKLFYGPIWDMDFTNLSGFNSWVTTKQEWVKRMFSDPVFLKALRDVYLEYRYTAIQNLIEDDGAIESAYDKILTASEHNDILWNNTPSFKEDVADIRLRLQYKIDWLDSQLLSLDSALNTAASYSYGSVSNYYNAFLKSSDISLTVTDNILDITFASVPARADVYVNGVLLKSIDAPEAVETAGIEADGEYVVTVLTYDADGNAIGGKYFTNQIEVTALNVTANPTKTEYKAGDDLDLTGLELTATFSDGTTAVVEPEIKYTYVKDSLGTQAFDFNEVTEDYGNVYAVFGYGCLKVEIPLTVLPRENYEEVIESIDKIAGEVDDKDFIRTLFDAWVKYDALSDEAKAKVENYNELEEAIALLDAAAADENVSFLGSYVDGIFREDSRIYLVVLVKGVPRNIVFTYPDNSKNTITEKSKDLMSIKKTGNYSLWTVNYTCRKIDTVFDVRANYNNLPVLPQTRIEASDLYNAEVKISDVDYPDFVVAGKDVSVNAKHNGKVSALKVTEDDADLSETDTSVSSEMNMKFNSVGKHKIAVNYKAGGKWIMHETKEIYVRESVEEGRIFYVSSVESSYKETTSIKIITDDTVDEVSLTADHINLELSAETVNGYKIWTGDIPAGHKYIVTTDGVESENEIELYRLGDVNGDGLINSLDALYILQHSVEKKMLTGDQLICADITTDGVINSADALMVLQISTGKI